MQQKASRTGGFTLIELLTVIAIIAILTAILFPLAGTLREQARASDCMSKMHQLWVSANVYRLDEGSFPPTLMGYAEHGMLVGTSCDPSTSSGELFGARTDTCTANADRLKLGHLYNEQIKDVGLFHCPDDLIQIKRQITVAYYPPVQRTNPGQPYYWPIGPDPSKPYSYIGEVLAAKGCPSDAFGTVDCYTSGPLAGKPKLFYVWDSYDIGPRVDANGNKVLNGSGQQIYDRHYSIDWTGVTGRDDLPDQLKYANPPDDKTLLTYCTWHTATAKTPSVTGVSMTGVAKKYDLKQFLSWGPNIFYK
jgi:prepilin-type N-terminal cleavage/methylation domain-containing protein